ncbi:ATP-binding protein [Sphaerisporangium sp. NPDC004334]
MSAWRMSRSFLGTSPSVREARRFVTTFLAGWPIVESAELIVSELAANAVRHTASGRFGGQFQVMIHAQRDRVWLGVVDAGAAHGPSVFSPEDDEEGGRGLMSSAPWPTPTASAATNEVALYGRCCWSMRARTPRPHLCRAPRHHVLDRLPSRCERGPCHVRLADRGLR